MIEISTAIYIMLIALAVAVAVAVVSYNVFGEDDE